MTRFLVDENLPRSFCHQLAHAGFDVVHVRDEGLGGCADDEVLKHACATSRVIVTRDVGFGNVRRFRPGTHPGIVVVRLPCSWPTTQTNTFLIEIVTRLNRDDFAGKVVIISESSVRIRSDGRRA